MSKALVNDVANLLEQCLNKDKEIERLNKCYCERTDCSGRIKNSKKYESMQEEIERLNNIISELEKFICDLEIECNIDNSMWVVAVIIHNKLKELKGSDKE